MVAFAHPPGSAITTSEQHLTYGRVDLRVATGFGPRVTSFALEGRNAFAELGNLSVPHPDGRFYRLGGGHRLWVAPEVPQITYEPDDSPVTIAATEGGHIVTQAAGPIAGIEKSLRFDFSGEAVRVRHTLTNRRGEPIRLASWAITQLPIGGTAVLPLPDLPVDPEGLQPNAEVVLWPYSGVTDTPFELRERLLLMDATRDEATKIGTSLDRGWLAYIRDGLVFVKRASSVAESEYLDRGAAAQCYCSADFVELETLGPVATLQPDEATSHDETWQLFEVDPATDPVDLPSVLNLDGAAFL